ncbi:hypothetical protein ACCS61_32395 [Rhizobium ruizarguesonis]
MTTPSAVYTLASGAFPDRYQNGSQPEGPVYGAQLIFTGPDAAIEVIGNKITQYMFGRRQSVVREADRKLRRIHPEAGGTPQKSAQ